MKARKRTTPDLAEGVRLALRRGELQAATVLLDALSESPGAYRSFVRRGRHALRLARAFMRAWGPRV